MAKGRDELTEAMQGWRSLSDGITFVPDDFEILDLTLYVIPGLRVCAQAVKMARAAGIRYPIDDPDELLDLVDEDAGFAGGGYEFSREGARAYLPPEYFPIPHEGELISRIFLALTRARHEASLAARAEHMIVERQSALWPPTTRYVDTPDNPSR